MGIADTLLSLGAIDFGIVVDSCVVVVENILAYRRDLVDKLGIDVNQLKTWDDFTRVGRELVARSDAPVQTTLMLITTYGLMFGIGSALTGLVLTLENED